MKIAGKNSKNTSKSSKKWTHLEKFQLSLGKFNSFLGKCQKKPDKITKNCKEIRENTVISPKTSLENCWDILIKDSIPEALKYGKYHENLYFLGVLQAFSTCISCFSKKTDENIDGILEKLSLLEPKDLDFLISSSENGGISRQNINDLISSLTNFEANSGKRSTEKKPDFIVKFVLFLENFVNFYLVLQKNPEKTAAIREENEENQEEIKKNEEEIQKNLEKTEDISETIANNHNHEETSKIPENSTHFAEFSPNKSRNNTPTQNNSSKNFSKDFTKLNKSLACQLVKNFEDFKLIKSPGNCEKNRQNRIKTNTNNTNTSFFLQENSVFENSEPFFQELRENRRKFKNIKQELNEFEGKNSKLLWENHRKTKQQEKQREFSENIKEIQEKTQKTQEFLAKMNLETSKERKEKLENRKKEVLALKKQRNLDKIKEKALMCETFQENAKESEWRRKIKEEQKIRERKMRKDQETSFLELKEAKELNKSEENRKKQDQILRNKIDSCMSEALKYQHLMRLKDQKQEEFLANSQKLSENHSKPTNFTRKPLKNPQKLN